MRVESQSIDKSLQQNSVPTAKQINDQMLPKTETEKVVERTELLDGKEVTKEKLQQAVDSINEFLEVDHKASKFVLHDGLNRYYVRLVDTDTDEIIKEIPPERLLDAFYKMQKLAGMIVDEKI
ncbi:flagellar protein FlaG [Lysinibacillus capsici]|uniref:flagellar protein FlaG n=2 Tax=Bacillaceae TaxID=186817 RepID=UPI0027A5752B|nr:flagellar protein FlaG [Lysinibacillus capsici]WHP39931.1 flagellar protein FlaG [Lysinibacillus boronitolerans]